MRSRTVQTTNIRIGKRFTERIGHELHQAATYALKQDWEKAQRVYEDVAQMIDTFLTETGIGKYMEEQADARVATVAPEGERTEESEGTKAEAPKGAKPTKRASKGAQRTD